ncbi:peptidoglycan/xylan/chitin deacetylase (PgdA/CDA1 family) [Alkalibacillus filiformis]|uniref:Peptidoglycan/xylan/chitin deacetylase (PgdA/CDA1 family) n=1 Tax=Alkalibacillus filiformis TaxID=200990 RepID=A0ABU0DQ68_9BACI|nr:polysaccharide deacetylase family protein [Alkalibacillus filiformis]MDQ0350456.1 peptidoglycan/xylan/chitin deacetylase (PgdA/CDA1 family) [Alkalibacillus filiformis]
MRKVIFIALLGMFVMLAACSDEIEQTNEHEEEPVEEQEEEEKENGKEEEVREEDSEEDEQEENDEVEEEVEEIEEDQEPQYEMTESWAFSPIDDANPSVVLLTIDDAPDGQALEMAETLKALDAPAIFFVNGIFMESEEDQEIVRQIHEMGFAIGNHTYSHQNLQNISEEEQREEIISLSDMIEEVIGEKPKFFRAPHGANTDFARDLVEGEGMLLMNWTYGYDYFEPYMETEKLAEAMITGKAPEIDVPNSLLRDGANLLMHDREWTNEALEEIVEGLRDQGYEMLDPNLILTPADE